MEHKAKKERIKLYYRSAKIYLPIIYSDNPAIHKDYQSIIFITFFSFDRMRDIMEVCAR